MVVGVVLLVGCSSVDLLDLVDRFDLIDWFLKWSFRRLVFWLVAWLCVWLGLFGSIDWLIELFLLLVWYLESCMCGLIGWLIWVALIGWLRAYLVYCFVWFDSVGWCGWLAACLIELCWYASLVWVTDCLHRWLSLIGWLYWWIDLLIDWSIVWLMDWLIGMVWFD